MRQPVAGFALACILASALLATGCGARGKSASSITKGCVLPSDQTGTLGGHWASAPIPIAFHAGDFNSAELRVLTSAADNWNRFAVQSFGFPLINYGTVANPNLSGQAKPVTICSQSITAGGAYTGQVVIYKQTTWPYPSQTGAIALTTYCPSPANPYPIYNMAISEVNYQNFFSAGQPQPDLQSIYTHEFGHLIGVNHSCDINPKTGVPNCANPLPASYLQAVMFPTFTFGSNGQGEVRSTLDSNDEGRANCLYSTYNVGG